MENNLNDNLEYPFISVIITTYNRKALLKGTLQSLCAQTYPKECFEVIVADNASTDKTEDLFKDTSVYFPLQVSYARNEKDLGLGRSRNLGVKKSKGKWLAFTDSDCVVEQDWLKNAASKLNNQIAILQGKTLPNPSQEVKLYSRTKSVTGEIGFYETCNIFYRRDVFISVNGFSEEYDDTRDFRGYPLGGEDIDLAWRIKRLGYKSLFADDVVVYHYVFDLPRDIPGILAALQFIRADTILPFLVKKYPELRQTAFFAGVFISKVSFLFLVFLLAIIAGSLFNPWFFVAGIPYLWNRLKDAFSGRPLAKIFKGVLLFFFCLARDTIGFLVLLRASIKYRSLVI